MKQEVKQSAAKTQHVSGSPWEALNREIVACERCPRLREHCRQIAAVKRSSFRDWDYWARPVPNFGDTAARVVIVGLAPAAHGANRTGRVFTGDRSGEFLFRALHRAGFANQPTGNSIDDGLELIDCAITATCHCAPPDNKPTPEEIACCAEWFSRTFAILPMRVIVALGLIGWKSVIAEARRLGWHQGPAPKFGHGAVVPLSGGRWLIGSYHPSQQNTFTGRLTEPMFDEIFKTAKRLRR